MGREGSCTETSDADLGVTKNCTKMRDETDETGKMREETEKSLAESRKVLLFAPMRGTLTWSQEQGNTHT